jgi:hypothetical protein
VKRGLAGVALAMTAGVAMAQVVELRQYKIVEGKRDAFVALFEREFVESQEAVGARLIGQFRDLGDLNRFVWIRGFPDMASRGTSLTDFYTGATWQARRSEANAMIDDNDNVLLLRPAGPGSGFAGPAEPRPPVGAPESKSLVVATIYYLWKDPAEGFSAFFETELRPKLKAAGLPVLAAYVREPSPNTFPRLPVREGEKVLVWFTRVGSAAVYEQALGRLDEDARRRLDAAIERPPQVLNLAPTARSQLR